MRFGLRKRVDDPDSLKFKAGLLVARAPVHVGVIIALIVAIIPLVLVLNQQDELQQAQRDLRIAQRELKRTQEQVVTATRRNCRRSNVQNAFVRLAVKSDLVVTLFPVINCTAAVNGDQRGVPLDKADQRKYIRLIGRGRLPIVKGAHVVDDIPYPPGGPTGREIDRLSGTEG